MMPSLGTLESNIKLLLEKIEQMVIRLLLVVTGSCLIFQGPSYIQASDAKLETDRFEFATTDWPWWRGPDRNGVAPANQSPPLEWDEEKNVLWKSPISGRGYGSPTVVGSRVFLATADEQREIQSVACFQRDSGKLLWKTDIHNGGFKPADRQPNSKSSRASSTVACDGKRLFINFRNRDAVFTTALDIEGKRLWQTKITDYQLHQGFGSSPALYGPLVIVSADTKRGGTLKGLDRSTGLVVWEQPRPELPNYPSPIILPIAGRDQLVMVGCDLVVSYDPLTGEKNWESEGATTECVTSTVSDGELVLTSGGYPKNHIAAIRADGSGEIVWQNNTRVYVPSMVIRDQHLYAVTDAGIAICYETATGEVAWKHRLGSTFTSSPILVGENIYITSDDGKTYIFAANPRAFQLVAKNEIAGDVFATPAICGSHIYLRVGKQTEDGRQEMLYCLGVIPSTENAE